jgi:hypothetical protein
MTEPRPPSPYSTLPADGPYDVAIGAALITMVEPHPGHEHAYNRWYEDDHFYAGAMAMPWMFAGRRWVATADLQALRYPESSAIADPVASGCYLTVYWITAGRYRDHLRWTVATNARLLPDGRVFQERTHVFTAFSDHVGAVYRDGDRGPRSIHALDYPYRGLVLEVIDSTTSEAKEELLRWLQDVHVPQVLEGSAAAQCVLFQPFPLPPGATYVQDVPGGDRRVTLLWFLEADPRDVWDSTFSDLSSAVAERGLGRVELVAPFIPTLPGTDTYVDQLR